MTIGLLYLVRNHVILYNIREFLTGYEYLNLLIATFNPLREAWTFCERTRIFTCLRPPSPCSHTRREGSSPGSSRGQSAFPNLPANANCALLHPFRLCPWLQQLI